ncbi:H-type small acid-soluble spore protein [Alkalihalobacillus sp. MEB130]|uniref:H-type small acid-soluble spore protein n=1 Tax=Alkalihalobacillus sp. MEB130 TaxID=2976704 RepID=UPI0028DEF6D6|nr:H-type small acid-soluble spore protein [Alkalihalobacillus sp. MEB130]MDT8861191.1 H-type small acid-soluble spore protein [Alkalihalobacillus sp. MEB130]
MNKQRAQEIAASPVMANVTYNETPVYIQNVSNVHDTARIFPLAEPQNEFEVDLSSLIEH